MDSRERLAGLIYPMICGPFIGPGHVPTVVKSEALADAILASDWLRDTLAAERERCVKWWNGCEKAACTYPASENCLCAKDIRNLEPEVSDEARG